MVWSSDWRPLYLNFGKAKGKSAVPGQGNPPHPAQLRELGSKYPGDTIDKLYATKCWYLVVYEQLGASSLSRA